MRYRASRKQVRARREQIHSLRSKGYNADEIYNSLQDRFPHLTLETVYADFKFLKEHSKEYIIFEYLPNFGDEFAQRVQNIRDIIGEAWSMYYQGVEESHTITFPDGKQMKKFLPTTQVSKIIRETFREAGFQWRPYVLRAYFDTQMLIAEARGKIAHDFRVFFMGHKGSIEATYTVNKGIIPDNLLKEMWKGFMRCEEFLDLEGKTDDPLYRQKEAIKEKMLTALEIATPEQLGKMQEMVEQFTICKVNQANG